MIRQTKRLSTLVLAFLVVASVVGTGAIAGIAGAQESTETDGDDSPADATTLSLGETAGDTVGPDDEVDWYAIDLEAGQTVRATGTDDGSDTTLTAYAPLADDPETVEESDLTEIDSQGLTIIEETLFEFTAEESGTYYFALTDDENDGDEPVDGYDFTVTAVNDGSQDGDEDGSEDGDGNDGDQRDEDVGDDGADGQNESDGGDGDDGKQGGDKAPSGDGDGADDESDESDGEDTETDDGEGDSVFGESITVEFAGITFTFGPPADPDGDGVYEDVTGDGEVDPFDALAHAAVVTAVQGDSIDLTDEQAGALDIDGDGTVTYDDAFALAGHASTA